MKKEYIEFLRWCDRDRKRRGWWYAAMRWKDRREQARFLKTRPYGYRVVAEPRSIER